jgi:DNA-binding CsgD family transcriptional regulator
VLAGGPPDLPVWQRSLRAALARSYGRLSAGGQAVFARLGVFAGDFTATAAAAVCAPPVLRRQAVAPPPSPVAGAAPPSGMPGADATTARDADGSGFDLLLDDLVARSLVRRVSGGTTPRFRLLRVVRDFALDRLEARGELDAVRRRREVGGRGLGVAARRMEARPARPLLSAAPPPLALPAPAPPPAPTGGDLAGAPDAVADRRLDALSGREREVLRLVVAGARNRQVAATLFLSERTVAHHLTSVYAKLGVASRTEAVALALRAGLR